MPERYIFHLSIPVPELEAAARFYVTTLGAKVGRCTAEWLDVLLWGHQITLQLRPAEIVPIQCQGHRHFGVVLPWGEWESLAARLVASGVSFFGEPAVLYKGQAEEQAKFYLVDPGNNVIELKAYRNSAATIGKGNEAYRYADA